MRAIYGTNGGTVFVGISNRALSEMTLPQLQAEAERVESDLARHGRVSRELGRPYTRIPAVKSEKRVLVSERERIGRELKRRQHQAEMAEDLQANACAGCPVTRAVAIEGTLDGAEYAEQVAP